MPPPCRLSFCRGSYATRARTHSCTYVGIIMSWERKPELGEEVKGTRTDAPVDSHVDRTQPARTVRNLPFL